jgi:arginine decarboxylase
VEALEAYHASDVAQFCIPAHKQGQGADYPVRPRDAFFGPTRMVKLEAAAGEIAAEPVSPYPPGVPVVVPGQRITGAIVDFPSTNMSDGRYVEGASDPSLDQIRVTDG